MANRPYMGFIFIFYSDGSNSVQIDTRSGPIGYFPHSSSGIISVLPETFSASPSALVPNSLSSSDGTISGATVSAGVLTVNYSVAPHVGYFVTVLGQFEY
jgi:hypothetical protein